ncbi:MAG: sulfite exporter TauE/SafE family protein [Fimbriimonadaceae bacterium]|nr:sulfite exporter TauE/SafE family protein [Fimbriimonadaceae bacterium]QYK55253.1 MAG: sulfite exporter TauE/SafE family protein [Fimbriimonadaceae bacterium]
MEILVLVVTGLAAGVLGGLFGIGGGVVIVPALVFFLGFSQHKAQGTSLVALLAPVGALAVWNYWREGQADIAKGAVIAVAFLAGGWLGSKLALGLDETTMKRAFSVFLVVLGVYSFFRA